MMNISQQIFSDIVVYNKYAKYIPTLKRRETWEEICERNSSMHIRRFPSLEQEINAAYDNFVVTKKVLPSMRSMQFGGRPIELNNTRMFNCFSAGEKFMTINGLRSFAETVGTTQTVLNKDGLWVSAEIRSFGKQYVQDVVFRPGSRSKTNLRHTVRVTPNHRWLTTNRGETTDLEVGDTVPFSEAPFESHNREAWVAGFGFGDGTVDANGIARVRLCGAKNDYLDFFVGYGDCSSSQPPSFNGDHNIVFHRGVFSDWKKLPHGKDANYLASWLEGYLAADGDKSQAQPGISSQDAAAIDFVKDIAAYGGYMVAGHAISATTETNYGTRAAPLQRLTLRREGVFRVVGMVELDETEEVFCAVVADTASFTLANGILTGNCAYLPIDNILSFSETMFLLLGGSGVGYSVQKHHVAQLPLLVGPKAATRRFLVGDSIEGWADAVKVLMKAYFEGKANPAFDFRDIRPKGSPLKTAGGKAPGPDPLRICLDKVRAVLNGAVGRKLTSLEAHDIQCHIADAVLSGGIRRAAMIAFFSHDDLDMVSCKSGSWWELNPQRGRANNSAVLVRDQISKQQFTDLWKRVKESGAGEPGVYWTYDAEILSNPCVEATLRPYSFCNLTTVDVSDVETQGELNGRVEAATLIGTLQASYTDFHYLRDIWKKTTEEDALIGVSMTGVGSGKVLALDLTEAALVVVSANAHYALRIGINTAARTSLLKPEGTASIVVGSSSGVHAWHDEFYKRRMRLAKNEPLYLYLQAVLPSLLEDCHFKPHLEAIVTVPQKAPDGSILRTESFMDLLERVKRFNQEWIAPGHNRGVQKHNVSCTISLKDSEWEECGEWMWENRNAYNGISVLPFDGGTYIQAPFESCTEADYEAMMELLHGIDLTAINEEEDATGFTQEAACGGGACEISF